jgi:hypothetical protein
MRQTTPGFRSWFKEILQKVSPACQDEWTRGRRLGPVQRFGARIAASSSTNAVNFSSAWHNEALSVAAVRVSNEDRSPI